MTNRTIGRIGCPICREKIEWAFAGVCSPMFRFYVARLTSAGLVLELGEQPCAGERMGNAGW